MNTMTTTGTAVTVTNAAGLITVRELGWDEMVLGATRLTGRKAVRFLKSIGLTDSDAKRALSI